MKRRQLLTYFVSTSAMLAMSLKPTTGFAREHSHGGRSHEHHGDESSHEHHEASDHRHNDEGLPSHYHHSHDEFDDHDHDCRIPEKKDLECKDHQGKWE